MQRNHKYRLVDCTCVRTSWEFPEIVVGKYRMISDADGKQYPWYGSKTEVQTLEGPTVQPTHVTIHMNDNFFPQVPCRHCHHCVILPVGLRHGRPAPTVPFLLIRFYFNPLMHKVAKMVT